MTLFLLVRINGDITIKMYLNALLLNVCNTYGYSRMWAEETFFVPYFNQSSTPEALKTTQLVLGLFSLIVLRLPS